MIPTSRSSMRHNSQSAILCKQWPLSAFLTITLILLLPAKIVLGAPYSLYQEFPDLALEKKQSLQISDTDGVSVAAPDPEAAKAIGSATPDQQKAMIQSMVDGLAAKLEQHPDNYNGWVMLSKSYKVLGQNDKAKATETKMKKLMADGVITRPDQKSSSNEKNQSQSSTATPSSSAPSSVDGKNAPSDHNDMNMNKMVTNLAAKLEKNPNNLEGWALLSNSYKALNQPDKAKAVDEKVKKLIAQGIIKVPPETQKNMPSTSTQVPGGEAAQAIMNAPPEEQKAMIQGMVDNLASKLKQNPNDIEGWKRLARSYRVLGETDKAKEAEAKVKELEVKTVTPSN